MVDSVSKDILDEEGLWENIAKLLKKEDMSGEELYKYKKGLFDVIDDIYDHFEEQRKSEGKVYTTGKIIAMNNAICPEGKKIRVDEIELIQNMLYFHITKS